MKNNNINIDNFNDSDKLLEDQIDDQSILPS